METEPTLVRFQAYFDFSKPLQLIYFISDITLYSRPEKII